MAAIENIETKYQSEVSRGERFEFGKNWAHFLSNLTVARIKLAESSLQTFLQVDRLDGKTFLDIGSGSGLFSLAARRLGARVRSFDYDPQSVACTQELRRRLFPDDPNWIVEQGSALDANYMRSLGTFDVVYSWGVLHHTGAMWQALENVKPLVPVGGQLFIAIYNDQGEPTDRWARIKQTYNKLPGPLARVFALGIISKIEGRELFRHYRRGTVHEWRRTWTEYDKISTRGMSRWHDWIDWIGGYPYERATIEQIVEVYARDGFALSKLFDRSSGYGCNEFVFRRDAPAGTFIDSQVPGGRSFARRFGRRVLGPFQQTESGWVGTVRNPPAVPGRSSLFLIRNDQIVERATTYIGRRITVAGPEAKLEDVEGATIHVVSAERRVLDRPFRHLRGLMWGAQMADLAGLADHEGDDHRSCVALFENGRQLPMPHAVHDDIDKFGKGRFSHWGDSIFFSTSDESDPNSNGCVYEVLTAAQPLPAERSMAKSIGRKVSGPFLRTPEGWTAAFDFPVSPGDGASLYLVRDDRMAGIAIIGDDGRALIAPPGEDEESLQRSEIYVVCGKLEPLTPPFNHERGYMWGKPAHDLSDLGDRVGDERSPIFLFEDDLQLPYPHAPHIDIERCAGGHFSHWESMIFFSTLDGSNPNENEHRYEYFLPLRGN